MATLNAVVTVEAMALPPEYVAALNAEEPHEEPLVGDDEIDVEVEVEYHPGHYAPARLHGHPDTWHPDESEAPEIVAVTTLDGDHDIMACLTLRAMAALEDACGEGQR